MNEIHITTYEKTKTLKLWRFQNESNCDVRLENRDMYTLRDKQKSTYMMQ